MNLKHVVESGKRFRRSSWSNRTFWYYTENNEILAEDDTGGNTVKNGSLAILEVDDILAYDWELEAEKPATEISFVDDDGDSARFKSIEGDEGVSFNMVTWQSGGINMSEAQLDKLLDFFYHNTKTGKSRIIPF